MTCLWTYPWQLLTEDPTATLGALEQCGVDGIAVASHYHSIQTVEPRGDRPRVRRFPGGCYFDPADRFAELAIEPPVNSLESDDTPLATIANTGSSVGLSTRAWTVCQHNTRLAQEYPDYRIQNAFGDPHEHALCPSHEAVQRYYERVVECLRERAIQGIDLESIGFPSVFHGHGATHGHEKEYALSSEAARWLFSQCFCSACRQRLDTHLDCERAIDQVRSLCRRASAAAGTVLPSLSVLCREHPIISELFTARAAVIESFLERLQAASGSLSLNYYCADGFGRDPGAGWPAGVILDRLDAKLDRVTALCYTAEPAVARQRLRTLQSLVDSPIDAGVTLDPDVIETESTFRAVLDAVRSTIDGEWYIYNHALATEEHRDWIAAVA